MSLFVILFLLMIDCILLYIYNLSLSRFLQSYKINFLSVLFIPTLVSMLGVFIMEDGLSITYLLFVGLCHINIFLLALSSKDLYIISLQNDHRIRNVFKARFVLLFFVFLYLLALYKQLSNAASLLNESIWTVFFNKGQALESYFLLSGWAILFRLCTPLALFFEYIRIQTGKNKLFILVLFFIFTSFLGFKKTEPIVASLSVVFLNYYYNRIKEGKILIVCSIIAVIPFLITIINFSQGNGTETGIINETKDKILVYFSYQHPALSKILDGYKVSVENNFQFMGTFFYRILGLEPQAITRGDFVILSSGSTTNVYSYWGSYFTQFNWFAIILAPLNLYILCKLCFNFRNRLVNSLFMANLTLCFFGNMFQFVIFYVQLFYIILISKLIFKSNTR